MAQSRQLPQSLSFYVLIGFILTLPLGFWLRARAKEVPAGPNPPAVARSVADIPGMKAGDRSDVKVLSSLQGETVSLRPEGGYVLLCFFSNNCPRCAEEAAAWRKLVQEGSQRGVATYLVSTDTDLAGIHGYLGQHKLTDLPVLYDPQGQVFTDFRIQILPQYLLFDSRGKVVHRALGYSTVLGLTPEERTREILAALPSGGAT